MKANFITAILYAICAISAGFSLVSPSFLLAFIAGIIRFKCIKVVTRPLYAVNMLISLFVGFLVWGYPLSTFSGNGVANVLFVFYAVLCAIIGVFDAKLLHGKKNIWYVPPVAILLGGISVFFIGGYGVAIMFAVQAAETFFVRIPQPEVTIDGEKGD